MNKYFSLLIVLVIVSCNQAGNKTNSESNEEVIEYNIQGNWCFLNKQGVYTESYFAEDYFRVFNLQLGISPDFKYRIKGDTLFSTFKSQQKAKPQRSLISWIDEDKVIMESRSGADTMQRMKSSEFLLETSELPKDSVNFISAFMNRNDDYLISRGILTREEVEAFRKENTIPEDVKDKLKEKK